MGRLFFHVGCSIATSSYHMQACRGPVGSRVAERACSLPAATASRAQTEEEVADAVVEADLFALASHQYWGVWALVQVGAAVCHPLSVLHVKAALTSIEHNTQHPLGAY